MFQPVFAWIAAAVFVASLGFFLYAYLVLFGPEHPALSTQHPALSTLWNVFLFSVFALHHSVFARTGIKRRVKAWVPASLERAVYTLVASVLFILVCWWWLPVPGHAWRLDGAWRWLGYGVQAAGVIVTAFGARALDVLDLAGVRQVQPNPPPQTPLETGGLYGLVRHPLYFGWALLVFGAPDMTVTRLVFAVVSTLYLMIAIPFEERSLIETFGPEYASYQRQVRWRMFPRIW
ncbi:MAG: isoprenylcysteine carboxylmethyltransferase family protein [Vicinamibacterales bacterium]